MGEISPWQRPKRAYARRVRPRALTYSRSTYNQRQAGKALLLKNAEKKGVDTDFSTASVILTTNTNAGITVLNLIQQGTGSWNRVGRKVQLKSIRIKAVATFEYVPAAVTGIIDSATVRMILVWDKQPSGAAIPTFDTIFGHTDQTGTEATTFLDSIKYDNMDRFKILRDVVIPAQPQLWNNSALSTNTTRSDYKIDEYVQLRDREVVYSGQSNPMTIADISTGALYLIFRADTSAVGAFWSIQNAWARLRYTDI